MTVKPLGQDAAGGALPVSVYERGATAAAQQMRNFGVMTSGTSVRDMQMRLLQSGEESSAKQHLMQQVSGLGAGQAAVLAPKAPGT